MSIKKLTLVFALLLIAGLVLAACNTTAQEVVKTVIVKEKGEEVVKTVVVTVEAPAAEEGSAEVKGECCDVYRIALFEDPVSLNYWNYLGPGSSVWTQYILSGSAPSLFGLSDQRYQFVPSLAKAIPDIVDNGDETYSITVEMVEGAKWSDGEPITAEDVVFTHNTCKELQLTQNWPNQCKPNGADVKAEVVDTYTVKYTYLNGAPSLGTWQAGIALAPILPKHFWAPVVEKATAFITDAQKPDVDRPEDCKADDLSDDDKAACIVSH